jgi:hypothetical protein
MKHDLNSFEAEVESNHNHADLLLWSGYVIVAHLQSDAPNAHPTFQKIAALFNELANHRQPAGEQAPPCNTPIPVAAAPGTAYDYEDGPDPHGCAGR